MRYLRIIEIATDKVEREFDITNWSESKIEKLEIGLQVHLNYNLYRIAFTEEPRP